jgi:hypothetical protein
VGDSSILWAFVIAVVAVVTYLNLRGAHWRTRRMRRLSSIATRHGWLYSDGDVFGLGAYDFELFGRGDVRGFENTVWGHHKEVPFQFADYWYATEHDSEEAGFSFRTGTKAMNSVIVRIHAYLPRVVVEPESIGIWAADPTDSTDIHFESEEFNRRFRVRSFDRLFAYKLIVPAMMQWLLAMPEGYGVEFYKSSFVVYASRVDPTDLFAMVACAAGIHRRIPKLVWTEYQVAVEDAERYWV